MPALEKLNFEVRLADFPLQAVHAACYVFLNRAYVSLDTTPSGDLTVSMRPKAGASAEAFSAIEGQFQEELLHRALRLKISDNSKKISEFIVAKALSDAPAPFETEAAQNDSLIDEKLEKEIQNILAEVEAEASKSADGAPPPAADAGAAESKKAGQKKSKR